ncbi:MAG: S46 family peptidase [Acidobacteria bacterium]|nr:S46 family peptidase [Acidobacteriota bacterium]
MKRYFLLCLLFFAFFPSFGHTEEGLWLYENFPKDKIQSQYGASLTQEWLDHLRLASVRFNNGGSGSFVSPDGLTLTNHHVGAKCIQQLSTGGHDYMKTGFYAATRAQEAPCPDLELNQLVAMQDVTAQVNARVSPGMSAPEASQQQRAAMAEIEKNCARTTGLRCDVIPFYSGEVFHLYQYKKYTDVRLVFAPEFEIAFFGGDADNFTYPRYDLDITFFRVYENGQPAHLENYLRWAKDGAKDGDLVLVSGNPGSTGRLRTVAQLEYARDIDFPARLALYARRIALLKAFSGGSAENARIAKEDIFSLENSQKAITGYQNGLKDPQLMARKIAEEQKLRAAANLPPGIADPWEAIARAMLRQRQLYNRFWYLERRRGFYADLATIARDLLRATEEKSKPNPQRMREYRDSALPSFEANLFSPAPIYKSLEIVTLTDSLTEMQDLLGKDDPAVQAVLRGKTPEEAARAAITGTRLDDVAFRKQLYTGGPEAVAASSDPMLAMMRALDPEARRVRRQYEDEVESPERMEGARIVKLRFARSGFTQPPDATFTLRLSYGTVKGYVEKGKPVPPFTTIGGAYQHAAVRGNQPPYRLPESWIKAKGKLKPSTPLNFVSTVDIIGGNSGSPIVNRNAEVVGVIFDGNIQSLVWNFAFDDAQARAVSVDSRGIVEALHSIYRADRLLKELRSSPPRK